MTWCYIKFSSAYEPAWLVPCIAFLVQSPHAAFFICIKSNINNTQLNVVAISSSALLMFELLVGTPRLLQRWWYHTQQSQRSCAGVQTNPSSGITSNFYIALIGILCSCWCFVGYDSVAHLIEETKSADVVAGRPMPYAIGASFVTGLAFLLALNLCIQAGLLSSSPSIHWAAADAVAAAAPNSNSCICQPPMCSIAGGHKCSVGR